MEVGQKGKSSAALFSIFSLPTAACMPTLGADFVSFSGSPFAAVWKVLVIYNWLEIKQAREGTEARKSWDLLKLVLMILMQYGS